MDIINKENLDLLLKDKAILEYNIFELVKGFEDKFPGANVDYVMSAKSYMNKKYIKTGMTAKIEFLINDKKLEL